MKRILSFLIVSVLVLGGYSGIAETLSVRNGIEFGMSRDEVIGIEKDANGLNPPVNNSSNVDFSTVDGRIIYRPNSVAGYDNIQEIQYYFDGSDSLNRIIYIWESETRNENYVPSLFSGFTPSNEMLKQYKDLVGSLSEKYELIGDMEGDEIKSIDFGNPQYIDTIMEKAGILRFDMRDFSQYLCSYDGNYVSISAYCVSLINDVLGFSRDFVIFEYSYCSPEKVEAKLVAGQAKIDERNNDL